MNKSGNLSINSENMLPIIKKWLYSDHDIFVREIVSNACDAITKLNKLDMIGEYNRPADKKDEIHVVVNSETKTISFTDTGIGMTEQEVEEYITQIAFIFSPRSFRVQRRFPFLPRLLEITALAASKMDCVER